MPGELAIRYVTIAPRIANGFSTEINAAVQKGAVQGGKTIGPAMEQSVKGSASRIGATFKSAIGPMLGAGAATAVLGFVKTSVDAFSKLEDATAAASVVFGGSMGKIIDKSKEAATTLGMSRAQVIDAANTFGTYGKSAGLAGDELATFSNQMTDVAGSLSSFKGGSPEEAIEAVGAALRGEQEPIRRYGILLDDATLRQQALKMGLIATTKQALTPQQKVLAAQAQIMAQSTDAMGDFARTATSTANTAKTLAAETANFQAEMGERLAPTIVESQRAMSNLLTTASEGEGALSPLLEVTHALAAALEDLTSLTSNSQGMGGVLGWLKEAADRFSGVDLALRAASTFVGWHDQQQANAQAAGNVATQTTAAGNAIRYNTDGTKTNTSVIDENTHSLKANIEATNKRYDAQLGVRADKRAFEQAIDDASAALKKNGKTLDDNTQKGRDNQDALDNIVKSGRDWVQSLRDTDAPQSKINAAMKESRADFIKAATAMGMGSTEAAKLASKIGAIKDPAEKARDKLAALAKKAKELDGQNIQISVSASMNRSADEIVYKTSGSGSMKFTAKALGGPIMGGIPGKDSVLMLGMPDEHVLTTEDVRNLGGHAGVFRMRALAKKGVMRFAKGGPVAPTYKGHSLEWWQDYLLSDIDFTRLQIQIRDLQSSLKEKETYNPPGKKKRAKRLRLRGLDRKEAELELSDAQQKLELAKEAANANSSAQGTLAEQIQSYNDAAGMWQQAAESLTKSGGLGSLDAASVKRTNAVGDIWYEKRNQTAADLASRVNDQANQVLTFVNLLGQLRAAGASEALISDVMALGTVDGTKAAQLFLSDATQRAVAEAGYAKLASAQAQLNAIGNAAAGISVTINEAATPQATSQAVINGILAART